jgi:DNA-binding transcriptional regulator YdaS (Cro superfamily)
MNAFDKLVKHFGSPAEIADHYGVSGETVRLWKHNGLPANRALEIEKDTEGAVTIRDVLESSAKEAA